MPVAILNNSTARFWVLPGATVPKLKCSGSARTAAMTSATLLSGEPARVAISMSKNAMVEIGAKSRTGS